MIGWANGADNETRSIGGLNYRYNARLKRWKIDSATASPNPNTVFNTQALTARSIRPSKLDIGVTAFGVTIPPESPIDGGIYVVGPGATGIFAGHANDLAIFSIQTGEYTFSAPYIGLALIDPGTKSLLTWNGLVYEPVGLAATASLQPFAAVDYVLSGSAADVATGAPLQPDGLSVTVGQRVAVIDNVVGTRDGIYTVVTPGSGSNGAWVRATDADDQSDLRPGRSFYVKEGAFYKGASFALINPVAPVVGVQEINFAQTGSGAIPPGSITNAQLGDGSVNSSKLAPGAVNSTAIAAGAVGPTALADSAVTSAKIATSAVTGAKIADASVSEAKLTDGAITNIKIGALAVSEAKIAAGAVTTAKLAAGAVTATNIGAGAVGTAALADGSATSAKLATGAVTAAKIAAAAVGTAAIADAAVTSAKIGLLAVTTAAIADDAVTSAKIAVGAVDATALATGAVTAAKIAAAAVGTAAIADAAVTSAKIGALAVGTAALADNAVTMAKLADIAAATVIGASAAGSPSAIAMTTLATLLAANSTAKETLREAVGGIGNTAHAVGSICFAYIDTATARSPGYSIAGSSLTTCSVVGYGSGGNSFISAGGVLSGTWQLLGSLIAAGGLRQASLWQRIA